MLILTRRIGEILYIGDIPITIMVVEVKGNQVKLGIKAPKDMPVHREEVFQRILQEQAASLASTE